MTRPRMLTNPCPGGNPPSRAGTMFATIAATVSAVTLIATEAASRGATPNSSPDSAGADRTAVAIPAASPVNAGARPARRTRPITSRREAPSAARMPISRVRVVTANAETT